ncbi:TPA: hypothetical protein DIS55_00345 [Candidatus Kaiserbacteria bacterium]|nr:hypothetical protein [Candidatus Kaiserbacteria bacterium]
MKYLGIDYGVKNLGLAISNEEGTIAFPRVTMANDRNILSRIATLAKEEGIDAIVIGDTRAFSGAENFMTAESELFAHDLSEKTGLEIISASEAWSSREATRFAPKGVKSDAAEAAVILQRFLEMQGT